MSGRKFLVEFDINSMLNKHVLPQPQIVIDVTVQDKHFDMVFSKRTFAQLVNSCNQSLLLGGRLAYGVTVLVFLRFRRCEKIRAFSYF